MSNRVSVEVQKIIDSHSEEFLRILGKWINEDIIFEESKNDNKNNNQNNDKDEFKKIGRFLYCAKYKNDKLGYKQFADLLMACRKAKCVAEFKLYIAYKGSKENSNWRVKLKGRSLAEHLNDLISVQLKNLTLKITNVNVDAEEFGDIYLAVLEKFLGYLYWGVKVCGENGGEIECLMKA